MFKITLSKVFKSKWLVSCLLIGCIFIVGVAIAIPAYTDSVLQRILIKDLTQFQLDKNVYPGRYAFKFYQQAVSPDKQHFLKENYDKYNNAIDNKYKKQINLPLLLDVKYKATNSLSIVRENATNATELDVASMTELDKKAEILFGKVPSAKVVNGVLEFWASDIAARKLNLSVGTNYKLTNKKDKNFKEISCRLVGVFKVGDEKDLYWSNCYENILAPVFIAPELFDELFINSNPMINDVRWIYSFDYTKLKASNIGEFSRVYNFHALGISNRAALDFPAKDIINLYMIRSKTLVSNLLILLIPLIMMLIFYIIMVSKLLVDYEKNEIAVLKSRGASTYQIFKIYLYQSLLICGAALIIGPFVGVILCKVIGASSGFLQFVNRQGMPLVFSFKSVLFALVAVIVFLASTLIPIVLSQTNSIVGYKRDKGRKTKAVFWQRFYLDFSLVAVALYGLYKFYKRLKLLDLINDETVKVPVDPMIYISSVLFILGIGLIFIRLYPLLIKIVFRVYNNNWSAPVYTTLLSVSRTARANYFIMLFLILTMSMGVFNSASARTINENEEDRIKYSVGADIVVNELWFKADKENMGVDVPYYVEPSIKRFDNIKGIESYTKVLRKTGCTLSTVSVTASNQTILAVVPNEFAKVATNLKPGLNDYHINGYMNGLTKNPSWVLVSEGLMRRFYLKPGDIIDYMITDELYIPLVVYAQIDYIPTYNPNVKTKEGAAEDIVIANFDYIWANIAKEPYEVWIKKAPGATSKEIYDQFLKNNIQATEVKNSSEEIIKRKNDAMVQGTNGTFTLSFIITLLITLIGFAIFSVISIKSRLLSFGILRSVGMPKKGITVMLIIEQVLISGASLVAGMLTGILAVKLFVPLYELNISKIAQVPPFMAVFLRRDFLLLLAVAFVMVAAAAYSLTKYISKLKITEVIKLGED